MILRVRPDSFDDELASAWNQWVLQYGLPPAPALVEQGQSVPVAFWIEDGIAAVLHVSSAEPEPGDQPEDATWIDTYLLRRLDGEWVEDPGCGGAGPVPTDLSRSALHRRSAVLDTITSSVLGADRVRSVEGRVGLDATWIEVDRRGQKSRHVIESPTGWIIICLLGVGPAVISVLDKDGKTLARHFEH
jgi:hypothetical protein